MIRMTTTAELRLLTLAWRHKGKAADSEELRPPTPCSPLHKTTAKNKAKSERLSHLQIDDCLNKCITLHTFCPQAVCCVSTETTFHNTELSPAVHIGRKLRARTDNNETQTCHCFGSVDPFLWVSKQNSCTSNSLTIWTTSTATESTAQVFNCV